MNVLVIAAHPDDEVLGCGGTMARHTGQGDVVHVLVVTRGAPDLFPKEQTEETRKELWEAHRTLGVAQTHFLDFPAPRLDRIPGHQLADGIARVIRTVRAETVYAPHRGDIHADHRAVYLNTLVAVRPLNGCPVRKVLCYETLSETEWAPPVGDEAFIPTVFVDITKHLPQKLQAMSCYRSQLKDAPHARSLRTIEALACFRGSTVSLPAAEAFMLVREIIE